MPRHRKITTTQAGLGAPHQKLRRELLPLAIGRACPLCGTTMDHTAELDHIKPRVLGGRTVRSNVRMVCRRCNRQHGYLLAVARGWRPRARARILQSHTHAATGVGGRPGTPGPGW